MSQPSPPPKEWPDEVWARESRRIWAALVLSPRVEVFEALLADLPVPADRLDPDWRCALKLKREVVLDEALVLRVNGHGPLEPEPPRSRSRVLDLAARAVGGGRG